MSFVLGSVTASVTSSCCYTSFSLDEFLDMPTVLRTKSPVLLLLVYVRLILVYIPVPDVYFSFLGILNLLSCLGALSPTISAFQRMFICVALGSYYRLEACLCSVALAIRCVKFFLAKFRV